MKIKTNKISLFLSLIIIFSVVLTMFISFAVPYINAEGSEYVFVTLTASSFVNTVGNTVALPYSGINWQLIGTTPYLNSINYPTSYIRNYGSSNVASGYAEMQNLTEISEDMTLVNVTVHIWVRIDQGYQVKLYLRNNASNGQSWTFIQNIDAIGYGERPFRWVNLTETSYFNTTEKINQARIGFCHDTTSGIGVYIDYVDLVICFMSPYAPYDYSGFYFRIGIGIVSIIAIVIAPIIADKTGKDTITKIFILFMIWLFFGFLFYSWIYMW